MKNKGFLTAQFHCRGPGDHAKAGNSRESNRAIVMRRRREAIPGPPAAALGIAELLRPLASLGVDRNDDSA
jgi:hypothetical protein